jgi:hypothetical protein
MSSRARRLLKAVTIALVGGATLGMASGFILWEIYANTLPHSPDPASGRIYRLAMHGLVLYQTAGEHALFWGVVKWSIALVWLGAAAGLIYQWKFGES